MQMRAKCHNYRIEMYVLQSSEKRLEDQEETFGDESKRTFHIDSSFSGTTQDRSLQTNQLLYEVHHAVRSLEK